MIIILIDLLIGSGILLLMYIFGIILLIVGGELANKNKQEYKYISIISKIVYFLGIFITISSLMIVILSVFIK